MRENDRYIIVPCELFRGFASSPEKRRECINNALDYALYVAFNECGNAKKAIKYLHIKNDDPENSIKRGEKIAGSIQGKCKFYISVDELFEFRDNVKPYNQCVQFLGYHALKSIQGNANYKCATNGLLLSRMDGQDKPTYQNNTYLDEQNREVEVKDVKYVDLHCPVLSKYATRYKMAQLRESLHEYRNVSFYSPKVVSSNGRKYPWRGFFFSTKISLEDLIREVELSSGAKKVKKDGGLKSETERILENLRKEQELKNEKGC